MKALCALFGMVLLACLGSCGGGVGSGGTGVTIGGGVGSGGTGVTNGTSVGPISGFGSIFVNGVEYDTTAATVTLDDAAALQLGMTVEVSGTVNADFTTGTAASVASAADLRGPVASVNLGAGSFVVLGTVVSVDPATVFDGVSGLGSLVAGDVVQVYGLLEVPGSLRATRVERPGGAAAPVVSGTVANLATGSRTFALGTLTIDYSTAAFVGGWNASQLADGMTVRVRAAAGPVAGVLQAAQVQRWHLIAQTSGNAAVIAGVVTDYTGLGAFRLLGTAVDASAAQITGGLAGAVGNGVKVEVSGRVNSGGVLVASKLKIQHIPGSGGPASFQLNGTVGAFVSPADFRVKGNPVDASAVGVVFLGGTAANLANGAKVAVVGSQVVNGVLLADSVTFTP